MTVSPVGDLDARNAPAFASEVQAALAGAGVTALLIDLAGVRFVDSAGLGALIRTRLLSAERGVELWLTHPPAQLVRLMAMTATSAQFRFTA